jgi:hypothetical protein
MCPRLRNSVRVSTAPMPSTATVGHRTESLLEGQHLQLGDQFASIDPQLAGAHRQTAHFLAHDFGAVGVEEVRGSTATSAVAFRAATGTQSTPGRSARCEDAGLPASSDL